MERITKRAENGKAYMVESFASLTTGIWLAIDKLADYEDAEEQGLLLRASEESPLIHGKAELEEHDKEIRNKAIDEFAEKLCEYCMKQTNCCNALECPFCRDGCDVLNIANKMKGE